MARSEELALAGNLGNDVVEDPREHGAEP
jgi:hypothetical protein